MKNTKYTVILLLAFVLSSLFAFQNCSSNVGVSQKPSTGTGGSTTATVIDDSTLSSATTGKGSVFLGPKTLSSLGGFFTLESPENCEQICEAQQGCSDLNPDNTGAGQAEIVRCERSCSRDTGLCRSLKIPYDRYTLSSFTVPAGYKKAQVTVEHCTDRNDILIVEGPTLSFKTMNSGNLWNARFGANVGRGPDCRKKELVNGVEVEQDLLDNAKVKIKTQNDSGEFGTETTYIWKLPGALGFPISTDMIEDMDLSKPVFVHLQKIDGPGATLHKIYDNYHENDQLTFIMEYIYWYDPKYVTNFDFYYKKKTP